MVIGKKFCHLPIIVLGEVGRANIGAPTRSFKTKSYLATPQCLL